MTRLKILQLNIWMGKIEGALQRFFEQSDYDVICLQEVMSSENCPTHLSRLCFDKSRILAASKMPYHFFAPNWSSKIADGTFELGNLILSKIPIIEQSSEFVSGKFEENLILGALPKNNLNLQRAKLANGLVVFNHHGYWDRDPMGNENTLEAFTKVSKIIVQENLSQAQNLANAAQTKTQTPANATRQNPIIVCGDFNITHESPAMRPLDFLRDLTHDYKIPTTLSGFKVNFEVPCDHILVNEKVAVKNFRVVENLISDHLGLEAEVEV